MISSSKALITIGITCFNAQDTIERAIRSAGEQDWNNVEIIVVDDSSTDNSLKIIENIQRDDKRVHVYKHEKNQGYPSALNTIIQHAKGEYIAFFDDDDDSDITRLSKQYKKISVFKNQYPEAPILCYTNRRVFIDGKEEPKSFVNAIGAKASEPNGSMVVDFLLWHKKSKGYIWGEFGSCTMMASKQTLQNFGFDSDFRRCAEWDLAIRIALEGGYFIAVDEPLVLQHKTRTLDKSGRKPLDYGLMLRQKHKKYLQKKRVYWGAIFQAYSRFYYFQENFWKSRLFLALACLASPNHILRDQIKNRLQ